MQQVKRYYLRNEKVTTEKTMLRRVNTWSNNEAASKWADTFSAFEI
jgi:hypothetical protein